MSKAFTTESAADDDDESEGLDPSFRLPAGTRNYITPGGHARLRAELEQLVRVERPQVVSVVQWAASNGDRSENADYIYG
ncbi:MAG: transcription elongation factor GreB, partial [Candidatus Accumulibacter sp.]|nr:transcription elongation factor GreB [Accumulibacter sp.]